MARIGRIFHQSESTIDVRCPTGGYVIRMERSLMPDLSFQVEGVEVCRQRSHAAAGVQTASVRREPGANIHTVALRCQIQLEVTRRNTRRKTRKRLLDLFGESSRWGQPCEIFCGHMPTWLCLRSRERRLSTSRTMHLRFQRSRYQVF